MTLLFHAAFNLLANALLSFEFSLVVAAAVASLFRVKNGRALVFFLLVPFAKALWDSARGIGDDSFFWERLAGARHELGTFRVGLGMHSLVPFFDFRLGSLYRGHWYG
ncbi:MAG TPA: hypothetical protein VHU80_01805, partial [Polyangiaceae bacterium]|nr:hypothetical protein [Polyangiaceae bacterium]